MGVSDEEYKALGANIVSREEALKCDIIVDVKLGDADYLDALEKGKAALAEIADIPMDKIEEMRRIGSLKLVQEQQKLVALVAELQPKDSMDLWKYFGNENAAALPEMPTAEFLKVAKRRVRE